MQKGLVGFGELLLRLDTPNHSRLSQMDQLQAKFTGGEANVLVAAKRFGVENCLAVSCVANHSIGDACLEFLNRYGVDTQFVLRTKGRIGILFVETGASVRPTRVVYDRRFTCFTEADPGKYNWSTILKDAAVLHITGTAPALGDKVNQAIDDAIAVAKQHGCLVSFDCSYRSALWNVEDAGAAFRRLAHEVDILFASPSDAKLFFGIDTENEEARILKLLNDFGLQYVAFTEREELSASTNRLTGVLVYSGESYRSVTHEFDIVDRIGSGDAFAGGILSMIMQGKALQETVEFATAAAALKHTIRGDFCLVSLAEVAELLEGTGTRIRR